MICAMPPPLILPYGGTGGNWSRFRTLGFARFTHQSPLHWPTMDKCWSKGHFFQQAVLQSMRCEKLVMSFRGRCFASSSVVARVRPEGAPATQPSRQFTPGFVLKRTLREAELVILRSIQFGQRLKKGVNTSLNCRLEQLFPKCLKLEVCSGIGLSGYQELERHLWRKVSLAGCRL